MVMLIVIEGIDGSGKTTQAKMLHDELVERGFDVVLLYEPTSSKYGSLIREKLRNGKYTPSELYRLFLKDRELHAGKIRRYLAEGKIVILDRYYMSTIAYQGAQGIPIDRIIRDHMQMPTPDIVVILDVDPEVALSRIKAKDSFERLDFLQKVRSIYLKMRELLVNVCHIFVVDANRPPEIVHKEILSIVLDRIRMVSGTDIKV